MAYDVEKLIKLKALKALSEKLKTEISAVKTSADTAFKSAKVDGNTVSFYTSADQTGTAVFTMDFPVEMFLDQAKTRFEGNFAWTEAAYPGSTNPNLDGKPVMVLAVKGSDDSCTYSFLGMAALVDTYAAKVTGKDPSTTVTVNGYEIDVKVNVSKEADNQLQTKDDGLYVAPPKVAGEAVQFVIPGDGTRWKQIVNYKYRLSGLGQLLDANNEKLILTDDQGQEYTILYVVDS